MNAISDNKQKYSQEDWRRTYPFQKPFIVLLELMHHRKAPRLSLCAAEPPEPALQRATQNGDAETENPEPVHHHHQGLLSGERLSALFLTTRWMFWRWSSLTTYMLLFLFFCWQDLVFFTDDCNAIDTGHSSPHYGEDRLQLLQEERWAIHKAGHRRTLSCCIHRKSLVAKCRTVKHVLFTTKACVVSDAA